MSKSYGNYIGIDEPASQMYGKIMSISDQMMQKYYQLLTDVGLSHVDQIHPMQAKKDLAQEIVQQYHGHKKAKAAQADFEQKFQKQDPFTGVVARDVPIDMIINHPDGFLLSHILCDQQVLYLIKSKSDFRRLVQQGAITVNGEKVSDINYRLEPNKEYCIKVGKTRFAKVIIR